MVKEVEEVIMEDIQEDGTAVVVETKKSSKESLPIKNYAPPVPYPQRLMKRQLNDKFVKFLELMEGLRVHIPFLQVMAQIPTYAKFLKEFLSNNNSKFEESSIIALTAEVSAILQNKLPKKLEDPGSFSIPVRIGDLESKRSLADLG